jgi:hypothetical protein
LHDNLSKTAIMDISIHRFGPRRLLVDVSRVSNLERSIAANTTGVPSFVTEVSNEIVKKLVNLPADLLNSETDISLKRWELARQERC